MKPRPSVLPYALLAFAWLVFAAYVWLSSGQLPERVATHFGANGVPNGWETHAGYIRFTLILGAAVPLFILVIFSLMRVGNGSLMNIPHKEYWLAPERRGETFAIIQRQGAWLAGLLVALFTGVHYFILDANAHAPANLPPAFAMYIGAGFLAATIAWVAAFVGHFYRKPL